MISLTDFKKLAKGHRIVPIWQRLVADMATPVAAFCRIVGEEPGLLLESVEDNERWSRFSFIGRRPLAQFKAYGNQVEVKCHVKGQEHTFSELPTGDGMLRLLEELFKNYSSPETGRFLETGMASLPFWGGVAGYLGYDIVREIERLPAVPKDDRDLPDAVMEVMGQLVAFDHWKQQVVLIENVLLPEDASEKEMAQGYEAGLERLSQLGKEGTHGSAEPLFEPPDLGAEMPDIDRTFAAAEYEAAVKAAKEFILEGDILQVVLSERFDFDLDAQPFDVYRVLRQINPSPYMFFLRYEEDMTILGTSPEPLVQVRDGRVISRPIAGTRPRGNSNLEDRRLGAELLEHPKEKAEHIMLVDLARNDLGRVVSYGSLEVDELMTLERYSHVMHMTSQVSGEMNPEANLVDVLRATFPAGTVSGAPKIRAMEIIDELEPMKRGPYAGMVGYLDFSKNLDSAIAIRTMITKGNRAWVQAGAGIVADSVPSMEEEECQNKAGALLSAISSARKMTASRQIKSQIKSERSGGK